MREELLDPKSWDCWHGDDKHLTIEEIKTVERKIQRKFPLSFTEIISRFNGCTLKNDTFKLESGMMCGLGRFLSLKNIPLGVPVQFPEGLIPCTELSKDLFLCFDYRNDPTTDNPNVIEWFFDRNSVFLKYYYNPPEFFPNNIVIFGEDGGGNYIGFDYRQDQATDNPPVIYWDHEAEPGKDLYFVANTFDKFLDMLYPYS